MIESDQVAGRGMQVDQPTDAVAIARSKDEPEMFALLFRRHAGPLRRYITRRIGPDAAEDVLAETFLTAFDVRGRYDRTRPDARPWLYGIATNLVGRHRRAEIRQLRVYQRTGVDPVMASFTEGADARVSADAVKRRMAAAVADLRSVYRDALLLLAWGDLTYEEIAVALDVPVGTIRSRISRARKALRDELGDINPTSIQEDFHE